jgi:hypothetical protein
MSCCHHSLKSYFFTSLLYESCFTQNDTTSLLLRKTLLLKILHSLERGSKFLSLFPPYSSTSSLHWAETKNTFLIPKTKILFLRISLALYIHLIHLILLYMTSAFISRLISCYLSYVGNPETKKFDYFPPYSPTAQIPLNQHLIQT